MTSSKVVIFGVGDFAQVAAAYLEADSPFEVVAFTVHGEFLEHSRLLGRPVIAYEDLEAHYPPAQYAMFVAIGFRRVNHARAEIYEQCRARGYHLISYVSSRALCLGEISIGDNCFVFEGNVIQPFVKIRSDVVLWSGNHIGHHAEIGDHCFIASHAVISGRVTVGAYSFIGVNATLRDGIVVGPETVIGAGALVLADTPAQSVYAAPATEMLGRKSYELKSFQ